MLPASRSCFRHCLRTVPRGAPSAFAAAAEISTQGAHFSATGKQPHVPTRVPGNSYSQHKGAAAAKAPRARAAWHGVLSS